MINKLAKVISAATVLAMAVSFAPQSALAQRVVGGANNTADQLEFDINTSATYSQGIFPDAIQRAVYYRNYFGDGPKTQYTFKPGDLKVSLEQLSDSLRDILNNNDRTGNQNSFNGKFGSQAVKYESRLVDDSGNFINFAFYAPYINPFTNLNSLSVFNTSNLTPFLNSQGQVEFPEYISSLNDNNLSSSSGFLLTPAPNNVTKVPEAAATASLLGFGIVSTAFLRKRNKHPETSLSK